MCRVERQECWKLIESSAGVFIAKLSCNHWRLCGNFEKVLAEYEKAVSSRAGIVPLRYPHSLTTQATRG
ncbi:hypothetical protein BKM88_01600 [Anaplasma marginale]|nr:hypothetical protein CQZ76_01610 [Anaplasma marginale]AXW84848.1 hypothetical protein BKM88_01600 [Anaplasma marginale]KAB0453380.1 hypothetical protein FY192_00560 [Anaplasma marginale]